MWELFSRRACFPDQEGRLVAHTARSNEGGHDDLQHSSQFGHRAWRGGPRFVIRSVRCARGLSAEPAPTPSMTAPAHPTSAPTPAPTTTAAAPSLNEPAPTPAWAESAPHGTTAAQNPSVHRSAHRHYAYRNERRSDNPVATVAMGVAGGAADLGSVAAYPFYCFPNYGSCSVRVPYRY